MTKITKETARAKFRTVCNVKDIGEHVHEEGFRYRWVDTGFQEGLKRVDDLIDKNWDVLYSKEKVKDDRKDKAQQDSQETDLRQSPVTRTTKGGHTQILMRIKTDDFDRNEKERERVDKARLDASRRAVKRDGANVVIRENVDLSKLDGSEDN